MDRTETLRIEEGMYNLVRELVYSSEPTKYAGGDLVTVRPIHVSKVLKEVPK
jgi:hypothetical protein